MGFARVLAQEVGPFGITATRRLGQPKDVAGPAAFVTGPPLDVRGGIVLG